MNQNSEEFYKQKYLKYKHKYLEAQKLYGEELEGGGGEYWFIVPSTVYNLLKNSSLFKDRKYSSLKALYFLLGINSFYVKVKEKDIYKANNKEKTDEFDVGIGINDKKKYTDEEAILQLQKKYPSDYGFFKINDNFGRNGGDVKKTQDPPPKI
jgi:hypothetical protein